MYDLISNALSFDGLFILIFAVSLSGLVRGFAGFGTAMIFVPIAATVTSPVWVMLLYWHLTCLGLGRSCTRIGRDGEPRDVGLLGFGH